MHQKPSKLASINHPHANITSRQLVFWLCSSVRNSLLSIFGSTFQFRFELYRTTTMAAQKFIHNESDLALVWAQTEMPDVMCSSESYDMQYQPMMVRDDYIIKLISIKLVVRNVTSSLSLFIDFWGEIDVVLWVIGNYRPDRQMSYPAIWFIYWKCWISVFGGIVQKRILKFRMTLPSHNVQT